MGSGEGSALKVGIVGAGISGMAAAWELSSAGVQVEVFERDNAPGGLAGWFDVGGVTLEKFYHHIYNKDQDIIDLIHDLGLGDHLVFTPSATGCFYVNKIYRLSSPMDLLRYKPLTLTNRIRLGLLAVRAKFIKDWRNLDRISAKDWIIKNAGDEVYEILWKPLFRSKFGKYASEVSAAWLWSKLVQRGGSRGKGGVEELGYFKDGYGVLFRSIESQLRERGVTFHYSTPVQRLVIEDDRVKKIVADDREFAFDAVLVACQLPDFLSIAPDLPASCRQSLSEIGFLANACLVMELNHRLSNTYWLNITDTNCPFVGVIEQTNLLTEENYQGKHLAYISRYMDGDDPYYQMKRDELFQAYLPYLEKIFPEFSENWIENLYLWRAPYTQPVVSVGYGDNIPPARSPVKGLYLSTMAQIFPEDRQMSNGVKLARRTARLILKNFR